MGGGGTTSARPVGGPTRSLSESWIFQIQCPAFGTVSIQKVAGKTTNRLIHRAVGVKKFNWDNFSSKHERVDTDTVTLFFSNPSYFPLKGV